MGVRRFFTCPDCGRRTFNATDIQEAWCEACRLGRTERAQRALLAQQLLTKQQAEGMLLVPEPHKFGPEQAFRLFQDEEWAQELHTRAQEQGWKLRPGDFALIPLHCFSAFAAVLTPEETQTAWEFCLAAHQRRSEAAEHLRQEAKARLRKVIIPEPPAP